MNAPISRDHTKVERNLLTIVKKPVAGDRMTPVVIEASVPPAAAEWTELWNAFLRAEVEQNEREARRLVAAMVEWHVRRDYPVPSWLEGYGESS